MCSTDIDKHASRRPIEITVNRENIRVIYLGKSPTNLEIQSLLLEINLAARFYTDVQLCIDFLKSIINEQILLIISSMLPLDILESIHSLQSIVAIWIYDDDQEINELKYLINKYPKLIDIYANQNDLLKSIEQKIQLIEKQILVYSLFDRKQKSRRNLSKESASFLWHQMLINILKQVPQNNSVRDKMLNKCSDYYRNELDKIELLRHTYTREQAIQWYTNEEFLFKLLNRALRTKDIEILYSFRFFIIDLCFGIEKEHEKIRNQGYLIVYRGQIMTKEEIEKLKQNIGCLISTNGFLSTSRDRNISLSFLKSHFSTNENVLFEIHVDLSIETIVLADISSFSSMPWEKEILFNINSLFKLESIEFDTTNNIWKITMHASSDGTNLINEYLKWMQKEMDYHSSIICFGHLLWNKLGQIHQAQIYFQIVLKSLPIDHTDIPRVYVELGNINDEIGEYNLALNNYQHAMDIYQRQTLKDYPRIASLLNNIGVVYKHMDNLDRAVDYYRQSLNMYETKCLNNENDFHLANTIDNLGSTYRDKNDFDTAFTQFIRAYDIRRTILPNDHPLLANSLSNIGNIYYDKNDFNQALNYYQQALSIQEISYSDDDLNKANTIRTIGIIYRDKQDWQNALNYFNRTLEMRQRLLSNTNHSDIAICYGDIGNIYERMNDLDFAVNYYHRQLDIEEQCLPSNHLNLILHFDLIINLLKKKNQTEKAIQLCEEKLENCSSHENHSRIARILVLIGMMQEDNHPNESDQYYQKALSMLEDNSNEDICQKCLSTMTNFYWKCRMFDRASICQMKLLDLRRRILPANHQDIGYALRGLARLYKAMYKNNEALRYFNQSLNILQINYGPEHEDIKNLQEEIIDLKDIIKSLSASPKKDYEERRVSNARKELYVSSRGSFKSRSTISNYGADNKPSTSVSKSSTCVLF